MDKMTWEEFKVFADSEQWTFSKTYAKTCPHEYVVRSKVRAGENEFERAVVFIRDHGFPAYYYKDKHIYLPLDGRYYWTMGNPLYQTTVINRCEQDDYICKMSADKEKLKQ